MDALVIRNTGSSYTVATDDNREVNCKIKGRFRLKGIRTTNPVAVGDRVVITEGPDGAAYITDIHPRKNYGVCAEAALSL